MISPHTPGPWRNGWGKVTDSDGKAICMIVHRKNGDNGNLIACAPELLSALEELLETSESLNDWLISDGRINGEHKLFEKVRAVISKAKGSQ